MHLDFNESRADGMNDSDISWTIYKSFAARSIQITTPVPHRSIFYRPEMLCLTPNQHCQNTEGKTTSKSLETCNIHSRPQTANFISLQWIARWSGNQRSVSRLPVHAINTQCDSALQ